MGRFSVLCVFLLLLPASVVTAEVDKKVQGALDWALPVNACEEPLLPGKATDIIDANGNITRFDMDTYQLERFQRKQKRWQNCVQKHKKGLMRDFETLENSAQYGLTQGQANDILGKMKLIQTVLLSPNGIIEG